MTRDEQIKLMEGAEERTAGYVQKWLKNSRFAAAVRHQDRPSPEVEDGHYEARLTRRAC